MPTQIPLHFEFHADKTFAHFHAGGNAEAVACLTALAENTGESLIFLWGEPGMGKSHLLQACCHAAHHAGANTCYLPLEEMRRFGPAILEGFDNTDLVCIDNVEAIAGNERWELALFNSFNGIRDNGGRLVIAANAPPSDLGINLADLKSRLAWGLTLRLQPFSDDDKLAALRLKAHTLGMELSLHVGRFLLARCPRDLPSLWALMSRLDHATLAAKRKLTLPFLKEFLEKEP